MVRTVTDIVEHFVIIKSVHFLAQQVSSVDSATVSGTATESRSVFGMLTTKTNVCLKTYNNYCIFGL